MMKYLSVPIFLLFILFSGIHIYAQQKPFEGIVEYNVVVKSKVKNMNDETVSRFMGLSPVLKVYIKEGHFVRLTNYISEYHVPERLMAFIKFKNRDTLYSISFNGDSSAISSIKKEKKTETIAGYDCNSIRITTKNEDVLYFYSTSLYQDPSQCSTNKIGNFNVYVNETQSVYLKVIHESKLATVIFTAYKVKAQKLEDKFFTPPALPETKYDIEKLIIAPLYKNGEKDWTDYVLKNVNPDVASKYVKLPKGEKSAKVSALVEFTVTSTGQVTDVKVSNKKELHPAIVKEAIRIVQESVGWKPATFSGLPVDFNFVQKITFTVTE